MIKKLLSLTALAAMVSSAAVAQTNLNFETWAPTTLSTNNPTGWETYNLGGVPPFAGGPGPEGTTQETANPREGAISVRMETKAGHGAFLASDTLGGSLALGGDIFASFIGGVPYTGRPESVDFSVMTSFPLTDTATFYVELKKNGAVVGAAGVNIFQNIPTWFDANSAFVYFSTDVPDTMVILATSSKATLFTNSGQAKPGSVFWLDDIVFNFPVGVKQAIFSERILAYPNPASTSIRFDLNNKQASSIKVTDITGKVVRTINITSNLVDVDVNDLPAGLYVYQVYNNNEIIYTDKFNVAR
jgi:hypothetical protein